MKRPSKHRSSGRSKEREPLSGRKLRERALDLLSRREHSERELSRKLFEKGAPKDEIPPLIRSFRERGYLNDARFAENFVRFRVGKAWGPRRYRQELMVRGISPDIIDTVLRDLPEFGNEQQEEKLEKIIKRDLARGRSEQKIVASLMRRGFSIGPVRDVLKQLATDDDWLEVEI